MLTDDGGDTLRYELRHDEEDDDYVIAASHREGWWELATYIAEQMLVDADDLRAKEDEAEAAAQEAAEALIGDPVQSALEGAVSSEAE